MIEQGTTIRKSIAELKCSINFLSADIQELKVTMKHTVDNKAEEKNLTAAKIKSFGVVMLQKNK